MTEDINILDLIPHRYPFQMVDRVLEYVQGAQLKTLKLLTANDWPFCHSGYKSQFYPETLLIEAAAQSALILYQLESGQDDIQLIEVALGKVKAEFTTSACIGDSVKMEVFPIKMLKTMGIVKVDLYVEENIIGSVEAYCNVRK